LADGRDKKFVIVPTACGNTDANGSVHNYKEEDVVKSWKTLVLTNVHMSHTHDPKMVDSTEFASFLGDANAVWFNSGRQREKPYFVLFAGDVDNMKTRKIEKLGFGPLVCSRSTTSRTGRL
jgi:hypothetical protein